MDSETACTAIEMNDPSRVIRSQCNNSELEAKIMNQPIADYASGVAWRINACRSPGNNETRRAVELVMEYFGERLADEEKEA